MYCWSIFAFPLFLCNLYALFRQGKLERGGEARVYTLGAYLIEKLTGNSVCHITNAAPMGFANILDAYDYLGTAEITVQTQFGLNYIENFLGYSTLFLLPASFIARGKVIATPVENIDLYYIDPSDSEFARLGLNYTTQGETNLIGFHAQGNYSTAVGESYAIMGMKLWAEYLDGIAVVTLGGASGASVQSAPARAASK